LAEYEFLALLPHQTPRILCLTIFWVSNYVCRKPVWNGGRSCTRKAETEIRTLLAEGAGDAEETVAEPKVQHGRLDNTTASAETTERIQEQGG